MLLKKKGNYKFSDKVHPIKGIISVVFAAISIGAVILLPYLSSKTGGNGGIVFGAAGMAALILCVFGFVLGIKSLKQKDIYYSLPIVGTLLNGILFAVYFVIYMIGFSI